MKKLSALILSLALSAALLAGCGASASTAASSEAVSSEVVSEAVSEEAVSTAEAADSAEAIQFTFTVTGADGESTVLTLDAADGEKLSTALADAGVISAEEAEAGFVTVVNGEAADYNKDGSWWCLTDAAGEMTSVGVADIELHDGDSYASPTRSNHHRIVGLVLSGLMGALLVVSKQAMSGLPNIEPVTLLIILFALELPRETPAAITVFILLQGVLYGFGLWWAMYLYIWYLLALLAWLFRRMGHALFWAVFSGLYGLCFGGLCAAVYLFAKTPAFALSWWLSGLSYDALHGVGNFAIMLVLYRPLRKALKAAKRQIGY